MSEFTERFCTLMANRIFLGIDTGGRDFIANGTDDEFRELSQSPYIVIDCDKYYDILIRARELCRKEIEDLLS